MALALPPAPRICLVMMSAVGDAVHALPVVTALKRHDPSCRITWVIQPGPHALVAGHPAVDEFVLFERSGRWRAFLDVRRKLVGRRFDLVLDLQVYFKASVVTLLAAAPVKLGFDRARARDLNWLVTTHRIPPHPPQHVQDQYFEFLGALGVPHEPPEWGLGPWEEEERARQRSFVAEVGRPYAAINLATSNPDRDWLPERWAAVVDALRERYGLASVLVGARSDRELAYEREIRGAARHTPFSALGSGLRGLVGILDAAELVLALDSAPLHMAVALDRPVISLMANADPRRTGPYRRFHDLIVDAYHDPGEEGPVSTRRRWGRMPRITAEEVLDRVAVWDRRYRGGRG
ncbi:MAG TPA: glycosyltransferase family 9 protein [Longimicrobiaceae bacterium]|nr:glycosyltransferase family 9 protein [Longimicrobiaceae bacterium]